MKKIQMKIREIEQCKECDDYLVGRCLEPKTVVNGYRKCPSTGFPLWCPFEDAPLTEQELSDEVSEAFHQSLIKAQIPKEFDNRVEKLECDVQALKRVALPEGFDFDHSQEQEEKELTIKERTRESERDRAMVEEIKKRVQGNEEETIRRKKWERVAAYRNVLTIIDLVSGGVAKAD